MKKQHIKQLYKIIIFLHFFVGLGAAAGGFAAVLNPYSPLGMPSETLKNGPFTNFLIPGFFLLIVLGLGNSICGILTLKKTFLHQYFSGVAGTILCLWIVIQCLVLWTVVILHGIFFIIGVIQILCCVIILWNGIFFPMNIIRNILTQRKTGKKGCI